MSVESEAGLFSVAVWTLIVVVYALAMRKKPRYDKGRRTAAWRQ